MATQTNGHVLTNGSLLAAQSDAVHAALHLLGRNLLSVDDSMMDLPLRQLKVCLVLDGQSHSMSEIGRALKLSPSSVSQVSDRLERRGLIERGVQEEDRRVRKLRLTRKGQQLIRRHKQQQLRQISDALHHLNADQVDQVVGGLEILVQSCAHHEHTEL